MFQPGTSETFNYINKDFHIYINDKLIRVFSLRPQVIFVSMCKWSFYRTKISLRSEILSSIKIHR